VLEYPLIRTGALLLLLVKTLAVLAGTRVAVAVQALATLAVRAAVARVLLMELALAATALQTQAVARVAQTVLLAELPAVQV